MTNLEQSFADLCIKHDLLNLDVSINPDPDCSRFQVSMQWRDETKEFGRGISAEHGDTIAEALTAAIGSILAKRGGTTITFSDEALPETPDA